MVRPRRTAARALIAALLVAAGLTDPAAAQDAAPAPAAGEVKVKAAEPARKSAAAGPARAVVKKEAVGRASILQLIYNPMMLPLAICSVVAFGFALERLVALRRVRVIPPDFVNRFVDRLTNAKLDRDRAAELCRANESPAARIFAQVVGYWGLPAAAIRQAIGHDAASELADLKRNIRVLSGTTTLAPLLGLLGTVIGMIESFDALGGRAAAGATKGEALAHGISLALGTTAFGLLIAVFSVTAYYYLLNRVDVLIRDLDVETRRVIDLVAAEAQPARAAAGPDRRDYARHEPRPSTLGRAEPV